MFYRYFNKLFFTISLVSFFISTAYAGDTLYFTGKIIVSKQVTYNYILRFTIGPQHEISGYSLTDARGSNETKTIIIGSYDSAAHTISYEEKNILRSSVDLQKNNLCFVKASLKLKTNPYVETLSGKFTGYEPNSTTPCAKGEIKLINASRAKFILSRWGKEGDAEPMNIPVKKGLPQSADSSILVASDTAQELSFAGRKIKISVWDDGKIDGDKITMVLNGHLILENHVLDSSTKVVEIKLTENKIDTLQVIALNEGNIPPNTAAVKVDDGTEHYNIEMKAKSFEVRTLYLKKRN